MVPTLLLKFSDSTQHYTVQPGQLACVFRIWPTVTYFTVGLRLKTELLARQGYTPVITTFRRQRWEDQEFKPIVDYIAS